jgi:hypothetical protein
MVVAEAVDVVVVAVAADVAAVAAEAAVAAVAASGAAAGAAVVSEAAAYRGASAVFADPRRAVLGIDRQRFFGRARESHPELLSTPAGKDIGAIAGLALFLRQWLLHSVDSLNPSSQTKVTFGFVAQPDDRFVFRG